MPPITSDRALRVLVAELATTTTEDVAAVLALLEPKASAQVRALLAAYGGIDDVAEGDSKPAAVDTSALSEWLAARTLGKHPGGTAAYEMTPAVAGALRNIVAAMPRQEISILDRTLRPTSTAGQGSSRLASWPFFRKRRSA